MGRWCIVKSCTNNKNKTKENCFKMHRFPKDLSLSLKWLTNCNRLDLCDNSLINYRVCSKHFTSKMYSSPEKTRLLPTAVPINFESTVCIKPSTVTVKSENDSFLEEFNSSSTLIKIKPCNVINLGVASSLSSNTDTVQEFSENVYFDVHPNYSCNLSIRLEK